MGNGDGQDEAVPYGGTTQREVSIHDDQGTREAIDRLIRIAETQVGYLEKRSNKDLDKKTANAGSANYTKYNRDLKKWTGVGSIDAQWCQAFVDWCVIEAFGIAGAKKLLHAFTNYTPIDCKIYVPTGSLEAYTSASNYPSSSTYTYIEE